MKLTKFKKAVAAACLGIVALFATGCNQYDTMDVTAVSNKIANLTYSTGYDKTSMKLMAENVLDMTLEDYIAAMEEAGYTVTEEVVDDITYIVMTTSLENATYKEIDATIFNESPFMDVCVAKDYFFIGMEKVDTSMMLSMKNTQDKFNLSDSTMKKLAASTTDKSGATTVYNYVNMSVEFMKPVVNTNGKIDPDNNKKVSFYYSGETKNKNFYATTIEGGKKSKVTGVKNNKIYKKTKTINVTNKDDLYALEVNGDTVKPGKKLKQSGEYYITAFSKSGKKHSVTITIDKEKPTVVGVENGQTYNSSVVMNFYDGITGVKSVTINGEQLDLNIIMSESYQFISNGSYKVVVKDYAGNKTVVKFKIKK